MNTLTSAATLLLSSLLFVPSLAVAQVLPPAQPVPIVTFSPDVIQYGTASGQVGNPCARAQVFGFPRPGAAIELQVVDARPGVAATFYLSSSWGDQVVPGLGRVLVDTNGATTYQTTTDANGRASVSVTVPANATAGDEYFVQCHTVDAGASPMWELSSAAYFEVGTAQKPIAMVSHLTGTITISGVGATVSSQSLSGLHVLDWRPATGGVLGTAAVHTSTGSIQVNGTSISDLCVQPGASDPAAILWQAGTFLTVPVGTADQFLVSFTALGQDYGPYVVPGTISSSLGDVNVQLGTIPNLDNNPLAGASLGLDMDEALVGPEYFASLDSLGLPLTVEGGRAITEQDVMQRFAAFDALFASLLATHPGDRSFFAAPNLNYAQFLAAEAQLLSQLTGGRATTSQGLHAMVAAGQMSVDDLNLSLWLSKLFAICGLPGIGSGFTDAFLDECGSLWKELGRQINNGSYKAAAKTTAKILKKMMTPRFAKKLANKIGKAAAGKLLRALGAKCVPVVGWAWLIGSFIWTFIEQCTGPEA